MAITLLRVLAGMQQVFSVSTGISTVQLSDIQIHKGVHSLGCLCEQLLGVIECSMARQTWGFRC